MGVDVGVSEGVAGSILDVGVPLGTGTVLSGSMVEVLVVLAVVVGVGEAVCVCVGVARSVSVGVAVAGEVV